jgi:hypothetical protein
MLANQQYTSTSIMRFQVSILCLEAALAQSAPTGSEELSTGALVEAERLKTLIEAYDR